MIFTPRVDHYRLRFLQAQDMKARVGDTLTGAGGLSFGGLKIGGRGGKKKSKNEDEAGSPRTPAQVRLIHMVLYEQRRHQGVAKFIERVLTLGCDTSIVGKHAQQLLHTQKTSQYLRFFGVRYGQRESAQNVVLTSVFRFQIRPRWEL